MQLPICGLGHLASMGSYDRHLTQTRSCLWVGIGEKTPRDRSSWRCRAITAAVVSGMSRQSDRFVDFRTTPTPGPPSVIAADTWASAAARSTSAQRRPSASPVRIPVLARTVAKSAISGSRLATDLRRDRTSSSNGANGFLRVDLGRTASLDGLLSMSPRFRASSNVRVSTVPQRRIQSGPRPEQRIAE